MTAPTPEQRAFRRLLVANGVLAVLIALALVALAVRWR